MDISPIFYDTLGLFILTFPIGPLLLGFALYGIYELITKWRKK